MAAHPARTPMRQKWEGSLLDESVPLHLKNTLLPEDNLEDLLNLPISNDLKSKRLLKQRSKNDLRHSPSYASINSQGSALRVRSRSSPQLASLDLPVNSSPGRARSDTLDQIEASLHLEPPSRSKRQGQSSLGIAFPAGPPSPTKNVRSVSAGNPRIRAQTQPRKSTAPSTSTPSKRTPRKTPTRTVSQRRAVSTSPSSTYDLDSDVKPPWLNDEIMYKSDAVPSPSGEESLASIAAYAQSRHLRNSEDAAPSTESPSQIRSWDDVVLPTVAKQIKQQWLEQPGDNVLITEWNTDGTPKKWIVREPSDFNRSPSPSPARPAPDPLETPTKISPKTSPRLGKPSLASLRTRSGDKKKDLPPTRTEVSMPLKSLQQGSIQLPNPPPSPAPFTRIATVVEKPKLEETKNTEDTHKGGCCGSCIIA